MKFNLAAGLCLLGLVCAVTPASAQSRGAAPTVLVIDASNSMWGRIDGRPKIDIAREAVTYLVRNLPKDTRLGLVAYGHRRAGDCGDIETTLPVGPIDPAKVEAIANRITPRGKTPVTGSLKQAAGLLENGKPGTVVIVTDGIETCKGDPCALAGELKRKNATLVAHVIGFDVSAGEHSKLSCIAERTGGTFLAAADAGELGQALKAVSQAKPKPAAASRSIPLEATEGGRVVRDAAFTIARIGDAGAMAEGIQGSVSLSPGRYSISAATATMTGRSEVEVTKTAPGKIVVTLSGTLPKASLEPARTSVPATGRLEVRWSGPDAEGDYIAFVRPDGDTLETRQFTYTRDGNPLSLRVPGEPGEYELRYVSDRFGAVLARTKVTATPLTATLEAPTEGTAGGEIEVTFTGPSAPEDWVGLAVPGTDASSYQGGAWGYAENGSPARLRLPAEAGTFELRYVSGLDPTVLATRTITVKAASAGLTAPARARAGSTIDVGFHGKGGGDSFVGIVKRGAAPDSWINGSYAYPEGEQVSLRVPGEAGSYEVRFVLESNGAYKVLASSPLAVEAAVARVSAPERVEAGSRVSIAFDGPKGEGDFVTIVPVGAAPDAYADYQEASADKSEVILNAPEEAGAYEVRYVMAAPGETGSVVIARKPLRVE